MRKVRKAKRNLILHRVAIVLFTATLCLKIIIMIYHSTFDYIIFSACATDILIIALLLELNGYYKKIIVMSNIVTIIKGSSVPATTTILKDNSEV